VMVTEGKLKHKFPSQSLPHQLTEGARYSLQNMPSIAAAGFQLVLDSSVPCLCQVFYIRESHPEMGDFHQVIDKVY